MPDTMEEAAHAFTEAINPPPRSVNRSNSAERGPSEAIFRNVGDLEVDEESPPKGGGDDEEDLIYGDQDKSSTTDTRHTRKKDKEDSEGDDAGADADDNSDASDESDDSDAASGKAAEDADPESEAALLDRKVEVTVDGAPVEVTLKEAVEGYIRTETFHRRMNQLDEAKKIVRRAAADAVHNYEYSVKIAKEMEAHMDTMIPKEPNWDEEFQKDPTRARELQKYYEKANTFRQDLRNQMAETMQKQQSTNQAQLAAFAEEESSKFEQANRKYWSDPKKKAKDLDSMRRTGLSSGFSEEELSQVYDSRMLTVLLKASKYDRMMANKPKPIARPISKPIPPGAGSVRQRTAQKGFTSAMNRLNRTGSIEDASVVFDQLIKRG